MNAFTRGKGQSKSMSVTCVLGIAKSRVGGGSESAGLVSMCERPSQRHSYIHVLNRLWR